MRAGSESTVFMVEPGLALFELHPGESVSVVVTGDNGPFEVTTGHDYITLWPSPRHRLELTSFNGEAIRLLGQ